MVGNCRRTCEGDESLQAGWERSAAICHKPEPATSNPAPGHYNPSAPMKAGIRATALLSLLSLAIAAWALHGIAQPTAQSFASRIERLSEEGGDFDTDNLISNERSYLHVVPALKAAGVSGGAYLGV